MVERDGLQLKVRVININDGWNEELMRACPYLKEYSVFVAVSRETFATTGNWDAAVDAGLVALPEDSRLKAFLAREKAEVRMICMTEYDEKKTMKDFYDDGKEDGREEGRKEGRKEGREEGREEGKIVNLWEMVQDGDITLERAALQAGLTVPEFETRVKELGIA